MLSLLTDVCSSRHGQQIRLCFVVVVIVVVVLFVLRWSNSFFKTVNIFSFILPFSFLFDTSFLPFSHVIFLRRIMVKNLGLLLWSFFIYLSI